MIQDTICAISTPAGVGGIAVARVSGPEAFSIVQKLWKGRQLDLLESHTVHLGTINDADGNPLDQAVITLYRSPRSFTGEDVIEISVHGSQWIQRELIASLCLVGCRIAEPGEFTRRAFATGRLDLVEAEAVADMIAADSRAAHRAALTQMKGHYSQRIALLRDRLIELASLLELELDFSEEEVEFASRSQLMSLAQTLHSELTTLHKSFSTGAAIRNGVPVAIVGPTNAGKSSLLNALTGDDRAIVSDIHGTTRDVIDDLLEIGDYLFRFQDTAGLRQTTDTIERIGIDRSRSVASRAHIVIYMTDVNAPVDHQALNEVLDLNSDAHVILLLNKTDIATPQHLADVQETLSSLDPTRVTLLSISTRNPHDIERLKQTLLDTMAAAGATADLIVTNARHAEALRQASIATARVIDGLEANIPGDLIAQDIRETIEHLSAITGSITTPDLLATIFTRFCIGK